LLGPPIKRNSKRDWDYVFTLAKKGEFDDIDKSILVTSYLNLKKIRSDYMIPSVRSDIEVNVYWGITGSGKSHRAFTEAGDCFYAKPSTNKWWDGYQGQPNVVIDEFDGSINVVHLLRWFDKWPCLVETKGGTVPLQASKFWITSNIAPGNWWADIKLSHLDALNRRITNEVEFKEPFSE
jgi:hypothetical protein